MGLRVCLLAGCLVLAGCQAVPVVEQSSSSAQEYVTSVNALQITEANLPSKTKVQITANSQVLHWKNINSPVAAFKIPADRGEMKLTITSEIKDSVFYPHAVVVNQKGEILERYDNDAFQYRKPRLNLGNRLVADIDFFPPMGHRYLYVIVYTRHDDLKTTTPVIHPGRLQAEAMGNYMPELKDIPKAHALTGIIEFQVSGPGLFGSFAGSSASEQPVTSSDAAAQQVREVEPQTRDYYLQAIRNAVQQDDTAKALRLLNEAKALHIPGAEKAFVDAVNAK